YKYWRIARIFKRPIVSERARFGYTVRVRTVVGPIPLAMLFSRFEARYDDSRNAGWNCMSSEVPRDDTFLSDPAASEARLHALLEAAVDAIIGIDEHGIIQLANPAAERAFGYAPRQLIGRNVGVLMPSPEREQHDGFLARYLQTGQKRIIGV